MAGIRLMRLLRSVSITSCFIACLAGLSAHAYSAPGWAFGNWQAIGLFAPTHPETPFGVKWEKEYTKRLAGLRLSIQPAGYLISKNSFVSLLSGRGPRFAYGSMVGGLFMGGMGVDDHPTIIGMVKAIDLARTYDSVSVEAASCRVKLGRDNHVSIFGPPSRIGTFSPCDDGSLTLRMFILDQDTAALLGDTEVVVIFKRAR